MSRILTLVLALLALTAPPTANAQKRGRRIPPTPSKKSMPPAHYRVRSLMEMSAEEIKEARPEISDDTLDDDMDVIVYALPDITRAFNGRGQSDRAARDFTLAGWRQLRVERLGTTERLSRQLLVRYVVGLGTLVIRSTPAGAAIELDGKKAGLTEVVMYPSSGTYRIRLSMDGYESVEEACSVSEGQMTEFNRKLKPLKPGRAKTRP
jgi:hypothetical protein